MWRRAYWVVVISIPPFICGAFMYIVSTTYTYTFQPDEIQQYCGEPGECSDAQLQNAAIADGMANLILVGACLTFLLLGNGLAEEKRSQASKYLRIFMALIITFFAMLLLQYIFLGNSYSAGRMVIMIMFLSTLLSYIVYRHKKSLVDADRIVAADREKYDHEWALFINTEGTSDQLKKLEALVDKCKENLKEPRTLQACERLRFASERASTTKPRQFIGDLAVLFAQAAALNPHFQSCVKGWASGVSGAHPKAISIKRKDRAIEKTFRTYSGDSSWLIDLVRSAITFETIEGLLETLDRIKNEKCVATLQIKNRLGTEYESNESAGYRNVSISLIVVDDITTKRDLDAHVCELQLCLAAIENIKNNEGHRRYVKWRDTLAL